MPGLMNEKNGSMRFPTIALAVRNGRRNRLPATAANAGRVVIVMVRNGVLKTKGGSQVQDPPYVPNP